MDDNTSITPQTFAILIGINRYLPNLLPDGTYFLNLNGCVRDVTNVETYLRDVLGLPAEQIVKLTASDNGAKEPAEPRELWPTKQNIIEAFKRIERGARAGDLVYIHYSGHGGRVRTPEAYREYKGGDGFDEVLVPVDVSNSEDNYLRDIELAHLLSSLVSKGLLVTIVLDSCHSGSATRGGAPITLPQDGAGAVRSIGVVDALFPPTQRVVASDEELKATWLALSGSASRSLDGGSGWLYEPKGYVLLSACRAAEFAHEYPYTEEGKSGTLTYWLVDALGRLDRGASCQAVYDRVLAQVHTQFPDQTPQLQGERARAFLSSEAVEQRSAAVIMKVERGGEEVLLNAGQAQGVCKGTRFAVYSNRGDLGDGDGLRVSLVEVFEVGATISRAKEVERSNTRTVEPGDRAVLSDVGETRLRRTVRLASPDSNAALCEAGRILKRGGGFLHAADGQEFSDFALEVNPSQELIILDSSNEVMSNLGPTLAAADPDAPARAVERLEHLARYINVRELENWDSRSPLAHKLSIEFAGAQADYTPGEKPSPRPLDGDAPSPLVKAGEWVFLRITNRHSEVLNVTALDLQPDWGITQLYPARAAAFEPLDPGQSVLLSLRAHLPEGYKESTDVIKVFATTGPSNFRWLELAPLSDPLHAGKAWRGKPSNPLEELLAAFMQQGPGLRHLTLAAEASAEWTVAQLEINVRRA